MQGAQRVIAFCVLTAVLPTILLIIPLYLRHNVYADVTYAVAESDILEMANGISTVFCQEHSLKMNSTFSAFQISGSPVISTNRKHIRLKKSMSLPDDTLEYWGFFFPAGSTVNLSVCSRYDGSRILVVKGEKNLRNCGLQQPVKGGVQHPHMAEGQGKVMVTFETAHPVEKLSHSSAQLATAKIDADFEGEDMMDTPEDVQSLEHLAETYIRKKLETTGITVDLASKQASNDSDKLGPHKLRHQQKRHKQWGDYEEPSGISVNEVSLQDRKRRLQDELNGDEHHKLCNESEHGLRLKRFADGVPNHKLDGGIAHGGNAFNNNTGGKDVDSSVSSFETSLLDCYDGEILLSEGFAPSHLCTSVNFLEAGKHMQTIHEVVSDGYYYYIFYSDNDYVQNDIHAIFDIHKPTYEFGNHSRGCVNQTECKFPISFWSDSRVVVEVPTRDGIEHEADDITYLHSTCHPRVAVYAVFPITVLFLILICAFL